MKLIKLKEKNEIRLREILNLLIDWEVVKNDEEIDVETITLDSAIEYLLERDDKLFEIEETKQEDDAVNSWYVINDIDIELIKKGFGIERACKMIDRSDLFNEFMEAVYDYPDYLIDGTETEQAVANNWYDDILQHITNTIEVKKKTPLSETTQREFR